MFLFRKQLGSVKTKMVFNSRNAHGKIGIIGVVRKRGLLDFGPRKEIIAGYIQSVSQEAKSFQAGLTKSALIEPNRIQALPDDVCQCLLAQMFGGPCGF